MAAKQSPNHQGQNRKPKSFNPYSQLANAVQLTAEQDQIVWTVFGVFWAANAVLLITLFTEGKLPVRNVGIIVSAVGVVLSAIWAIIQLRALAHLRFYDSVIHRIEEKYIDIPQEVALSERINEDLSTRAMEGTVRVRPILKGSGIVVTVFWLIFLILFIVCL